MAGLGFSGLGRCSGSSGSRSCSCARRTPVDSTVGWRTRPDSDDVYHSTDWLPTPLPMTYCLLQTGKYSNKSYSRYFSDSILMHLSSCTRVCIQWISDMRDTGTKHCVPHTRFPLWPKKITCRWKAIARPAFQRVALVERNVIFFFSAQAHFFLVKKILRETETNCGKGRCYWGQIPYLARAPVGKQNGYVVCAA